MMSKAGNLYRLKALALLSLILMLGLLFASCKPASQGTSTPSKDAEVESPPITVTPVIIPDKPAAEEASPVPVAPPAPVTPPAAPGPAPATQQSPTRPADAAQAKILKSVRKQIEATRDLIQLHELKQSLTSAGKLSPEDSAAIEAKHKALLDKATVVHFTEKLDVLGADMRMLGPHKARIYILFRPNEQLTSDYRIGLNAVVDKADEKYLSAKADKKSLAETISFWPPSTKEWTPGKEVLVTTDADLKPIKYRLSLGLYANEPPHRLGEVQIIAMVADSGYKEGMESEEAKIDAINACKGLIPLHEKAEALKAEGPLSPRISAAIGAKHATLLDKATVVSFTDKLDVLDVDMRSIGPDKKRIYILFRPNTKLTSDYRIALSAFVDKSFAKQLSAKADKKLLAEKMSFWPPSTKKWIPGELVLVTHDAELKSIPYRLAIGLFANEPPHRLGDFKSIAWFAAIED